MCAASARSASESAAIADDRLDAGEPRHQGQRDRQRTPLSTVRVHPGTVTRGIYNLFIVRAVAGVTFQGVSKIYPDGTTGGQRPQPGNRGRRVPRPGRPVRLRQDDCAADGRRSRGDLGGPAEDRRADRQPRAVARPRHRDGLPELRALPASLGLRQHRLQPEAEEDGQEGDRPARQRCSAPARPRPLSRPQAARALRRPAPARRDGPRDRARTGRVPDGRAALQPRREAARADARRDQEAPGRPRHDDDLRHARPGRGDDDGRPRRRDAQGRAAAGRRATEAVRPAGEPLRRRLHRQPGDEPRRGDARARGRRIAWLWRAASGSHSARRRSRPVPA